MADKSIKMECFVGISFFEVSEKTLVGLSFKVEISALRHLFLLNLRKTQFSFCSLSIFRFTTVTNTAHE